MFTRILFLVFLCATTLSGQNLRLEIGDKGAVINGSAFGRLTLTPPTVSLANKKSLKAVYEREEDGGAVARYSNGFVLKIAVSGTGKDLVYRFDHLPDDVVSLKFSTTLPIMLTQGGRFVIGDDEPGAFPEVFSKQIIGEGNAGQITLIHPLGERLVFHTPKGLYQLQDNRTWGTKSFSWAYFHRLKKRSAKTITMSVDAAPAAALAGDSTPSPKFLVDRFGQSARKEYPGKVKTEDELRRDGLVHQASLATDGGPAKDGFGGLAGSGEKLGLKKNGFFHVEEIDGGRQVLVTPEGNLFFQLGVCGIANTDDFTLVKGRENIYEWLPARKDEKYATAWRDGNPGSGIFSFYIANWIRKFDRPFDYEEWSGQVVDRLRAWGFNSAGAFTRYSESMRTRSFPYVGMLPLKAKGLALLPDKLGADKLFDPFAPGVEEALDRAFAGVASRADDPLLIGYFLGNEQHLELLPRLIPAYKASKVAAKARLVEELREKYRDIARFNQAWKPATPFGGFDELKEAVLFVRTDEGAADMKAFANLYLETYYAMVRRVFRRNDPNHLLIGSRWTPNTATNEGIVAVGGRHVDVVSVNYYTYGIDADFLRRIHEWSGGKPIILSEWYYSSMEQGLSGGKVRNQDERAAAYRNYTEQAAALPFVVGTQWFIYTDQSITGRFFQGFNGEGNNTGLVDVTDRPYPALVAAAKQSNDRVYDVILGRVKPFVFDDPRFTGKGGKGGRKTVSVPRAQAEIALDGLTTNWPTRPAEPIGAASLVQGNPNPDLRGDFRLCWDERNLHFLIQVADATPFMNEKAPRSYWSGDSVELFIGGRNLGESGAMLFSDRQIIIGVGRTPGLHIADHPEEEKACAFIVTKDVTGDGYVVQVSIPWSILGITPKHDLELLFDVAINNSDNGIHRLQQFVWNGTSKNSGDRSVWGTALISDN